jgi:uncharacterized protein (TIGR03435 family)
MLAILGLLGCITSANLTLAQSQARSSTANAFVFEVASIRPEKSGNGMFKVGWLSESRFTARGTTPQMLIRLAYGVDDNQISAGPNRLDSESYEIDATADESVAELLHKLSDAQRKLATEHMLQALLADRFALRTHRETKELPVYALVTAKHGPKLKQTNAVSMMRMGRGELVSRGVPLALLVDQLSMRLGRTVVDKTGLKGSYAFTLRWTPEEDSATLKGPDSPESQSVPASETSGPSIFTALQEQLGLKLESTKAPIDFLVIDHIEKPSAN